MKQADLTLTAFQSKFQTIVNDGFSAYQILAEERSMLTISANPITLAVLKG